MRRIALVLVGALVALGAALGHSTSAQAPTDEPAVVWAVGDGADGTAAAKAVARQIARGRPKALLYLGDVYETGTAAEFRVNFGGVYGRLARITHPTPGNHEWGKRGEGYFPYWKRIKGRALAPWYRVRIGGWEIFSLNSETDHGPGSRQLRWLRDRLRGARGTCRIAFWHRPRYSSGLLHPDDPTMAPLWNAVRRRFRLVLNGHDHNLQRMSRKDGLNQYIIGAGGRGRYPLNAGDRRFPFARSDVDGALRMALRPGSARLEIKAANGRVLDRSRVSCRR